MPSLQQLIDLPALALLIIANSTPVVIALILRDRASAPIDAGFRWRDGRPLLGSHKTWRGLVTGTGAAALAGAWLSYGWTVGAAFGALALVGDLCSSFLKRRLQRASGSWTPLLDQLPEALLPLILLREALQLSAASIAGTTVAFTITDLVAAKLITRRRA